MSIVMIRVPGRNELCPNRNRTCAGVFRVQDRWSPDRLLAEPIIDIDRNESATCSSPWPAPSTACPRFPTSRRWALWALESNQDNVLI